jgi:putative membrane protein
MKIAMMFTMSALGVMVAGLHADDTRRGEKEADQRFTDKMFVEKAAMGGMFEVKSSQLARQLAGNSAVKDFASQMIADHTKANQELMALARHKGWQLPTTLDEKHKALLEQLRAGQGGGSGSIGDRFDRAYIDIQVKAHDKTVALFEKAITEAQDPDLKAWATKTLPTLKEHQKVAKQLDTRGTRPDRATAPPR